MRRSALLIALLACGCGSRSAIPSASDSGGAAASGGGPSLACSVDADCSGSDACGEQHCMNAACIYVAFSCDDFNACTEDSCDPALGCQHRDLALDMDGDGHKAPRPGFAPGSPGACGDDCDDTNPAVFPDNKEICDGLDNDCNGVVDDGLSYRPSSVPPLRISSAGNDHASRDGGGFSATPKAFVLTYTSIDTAQHSRALIKGFDSSGAQLFENPVSDANAETFAGPLAFSGETLTSAWADAHLDGNYDVYAGFFAPSGMKSRADTRVSDARNFSLHPDIRWNQSEYLIAFDDRRDETAQSGDVSRIYAQRLAPDGSLLQGNLLLVSDDPVAENPIIALSPRVMGLVYTTFSQTSQLGFRVFDATLTPVGPKSAPLASDVHAPSVTYLSAGRFVAVWDVYGANIGNAIWAATFDEQGNPIAPPRAVTSGASFARTHAELSLGDRMLLVWADDHDGNYELYFEVLAPDLSVLSARQRITFDATDSVNPAVVAGPAGQIGIVFDDWLEGARQVYFSALDCTTKP